MNKAVAKPSTLPPTLQLPSITPTEYHHLQSVPPASHNNAANLATAPLLPTHQLTSKPAQPLHHTIRTFLWVENLVFGDNFLIDFGSKVSAVPPTATDRECQSSTAYDLLAANKASQELLTLLGTKRQRTTVYHPSSNGMFERLHRKLKDAFRMYQPDQ
ncbi:hypothetical protein Pmani_020920 [Petrolisthes manimaculis]|uniref:Integrase catalytic domain-containing protein n=1 Tax=Petrolisthes manimaculis TaxID=1843537 RepID=A0AAE1PGN7_9EUCA|nr:hypothetical protein Pmani_020920 [Petrolisthes manimaculis]